MALFIVGIQGSRVQDFTALGLEAMGLGLQYYVLLGLCRVWGYAAFRLLGLGLSPTPEIRKLWGAQA